MKLAATLILVIFFWMQLSSSVPVPEKLVDDSCDEEVFQKEKNSTCDLNDEKCNVSNEKKRLKRQTLCERNPGCEFCGTQIIESGETFGNPELIERDIIIENDNETQYYRGYVESAANITTVIRLTNHIHNENIINMPTTLNNTNINNIHVYQNTSSSEGGKYGLGYTEKGSCCYAVQPKSCRHSTGGLKCHQKKQKVCGRQCTHKVIHLRRSPCKNIPQWPYRICQQNTQQYKPAFNPGFYPPPGFPSFYPLQVPFLDQNEIDGHGFDDDDDDDDDDFPLIDGESEKLKGDWIVGSSKCKVVSEDGSEIKDCPEEGPSEHPFARNTVDQPVKRKARHTKSYDAPPQNQNQMMQQEMMYQQPISFQPMPMYMPQYYPPPWSMGYYNQPSQAYQPYFEQFQSDEESE